MNNFIMFVGQPASGKTTFMQSNEQGIINTYGIGGALSSDAIIEEVAISRGLTYSEVFKDSIKLATAYVENMIGILSLEQRNFIVDQTNLTVKSRKRKLNLLIHPQNYNKIAVVFNDTSEEDLNSRLKTRDGKIIPEDIITNMRKSFEYPTVEEGFNKVMTAQEFKDTLITNPIYGGTKFA